jgi:hypothetical protein
LSALAVMQGEDSRRNSKTLHAERHTCRHPQPAAIPPLPHQLIGRRPMPTNRRHLVTGSSHRNVGLALRPDHPFHLAKCLVQPMSIKTESCSEGLVLGGGRHPALHRQKRQERPDIRRRARGRILAACQGLQVPQPRSIGVQGLRRGVPDPDVIGQPGVEGDPGNSRGRGRVVGGRDGLRRRGSGGLRGRAGCWGGAWCTGSRAQTRRQDLERLRRRSVVVERRDLGVGIPQAPPLVIPRDRV